MGAKCWIKNTTQKKKITLNREKKGTKVTILTRRKLENKLLPFFKVIYEH